jgi:hypothetical protein
LYVFFFFFKQKTAYEIGTGDGSSDVCSSDLGREQAPAVPAPLRCKLIVRGSSGPPPSR